jgi:hypothetical protein
MLLNDDSWLQQSGDLLTAVGKCGRTVGAFSACREFIDAQDRGQRINALWAIGRIGSRERVEPLPIAPLVDAIPEIAQRTMPKYENHVFARKHAVYALGEIGDRRPFAHEAQHIDDDYANFLLDLLEKIATTPVPTNSSSMEETHLRRLADIASLQILGETLSEEQERVLMSVRTLMSTTQDES